MPEADFKTVPDELLHVGAALEQHLAENGYDVTIEGSELGFPFTPTIMALRDHQTLIIELSSLIDHSRLSRWVKFCRSQSADTRLCAVISHDAAHEATTNRYCQENRLGLWTFHDGRVVELRAPVDLAVQVDLPTLAELAPKLRRYLAGPFRKISTEDWRDGLNDIYLAIEDEARKYLVEGILRTRIAVVVDKKGRLLTVEEVDKMTLGQLKEAFKNIRNQNQKDALIGNTLALLNPNRVKLIHSRRDSEAERAIRRDVGRHIWAAIGCLEEILK